MIFLKPELKNYIWGGDRLYNFLNIKPDNNKIAEAWMLADHKDGQSIVDCGDYKGLTLNDYLNKSGIEFFGRNRKNSFDRFPILIKLIDAKTPLSIQVHPNDDYASKENEYGKAEMWYIIDCEPGSFIYYGLNSTITKTEFIDRVKNGTIEQVLNKVKVEKSDTIFIEPGILHAIGGGITLCEVQQNSNLTYRVYDYKRVDKDGKPRKLDIDKALEVVNLRETSVGALRRSFARLGNNKVYTLADNKYFKTRLLELDGEYMGKVLGSTFLSIIVLDDGIHMYNKDERYTLKKGDSIFFPTGINEVLFKGKGKLILTTI